MKSPQLAYQPVDPKNYNPPIGLVGCGGITSYHLTAYKSAGYRVVALCDINLEQAKSRRDAFYPEATVFADHRALLKLDEIEVVDVATHPNVRGGIIRDSLLAGKHVLSQKPFVLDLDEGEQLAALAAKKNVRLAVNQNARWAPHFSYIREAIRAGILGKVASAHMAVHWDHSWVAGTAFETIEHLMLYDFAIHWFDLVNGFFDGRPVRAVYASTAKAPQQTIQPHLLAQALVEYEDAQVSLVFDGLTRFGPLDLTTVTGTKGTVRSMGKDLHEQQVELETAKGIARPVLIGKWFSDGFHGTMGELLLSIEQNREPSIGAAGNLASLALCFAAVESSRRHEPIVPGEVRRLPGS